jgi:hypothetical protein
MGSASIRHRVLMAFAICFAFVSLYHLAAACWTSIDPTSSRSRHALFVLVDAGFAYGLWRRPRGFFWVFAALAVQQIHSHGRVLLNQLRDEHRLDWASAVVLAAVVVVTTLLWQQRGT